MHAFDSQIESGFENLASSERNIFQNAGESLSKEGNSRFASYTNQIEKFTPDASKRLGAMDTAINWQRDSKGNYVTKNRWGRLLTRDDRGRMVDYANHVDSKRNAARQQMAFTSVLFCNPMMLFGLGATFAFMDQFHQSNRRTEYQLLQDKLEGKKLGKQAKGYSQEKELAKALTLINDRRLDNNDITSKLEEDRIRSKKRKLSADAPLIPNRSNGNGRRIVQSLGEKSNLSRNKLVKMKAKLEEQLEQMRGQADLKDVATIESQIEKLDRALKRFSALSM